MQPLRVLFYRLTSLVRGKNLERDLDDELRFHLQMETDHNRRSGMDPEEARVTALRRFGGVSQVKERYRETGSLPFLQIFWQDLRFGLRMIRRNPGFALLATLCLTVGIGSNAAVFSWIEGVLLRPFPLVVEQERLMAVAGSNRGLPGHTDVSSPDWADFQRDCKLIEAFIGDKITGVTLSIGDRAVRTPASIVSANYFDALGVRPILGRGFQPGEDNGRNAHPVTVISFQLWKERYKGDPNIIGKTQMLNGMPHTIIGVAPEGFYGTFVGWAMQFWVPASMQERFSPPGYKLDSRGAQWIEGFVRLKPGVTGAQAQAEVSAVASRLEREYPTTNRGRGVELYPLWRTPFNNARTLLPTLSIALAVVASVFLIACANVSNLLLVRAFGRRQEMTIRLAVGSGRGRIVRQLLTESLILAAIAAAGGMAMAYLCRDLLMLLLPARGGTTMFLPGAIDWRVLAASTAVCFAATLLFGLAPAWQTSKVDLAAALKAESGGVVGGRGRARARSVLVLVQVSLSFVLLVGAGLLLESLSAMQGIDPGFSTRNVYSSSVDTRSAGYELLRTRTFQDSLVDRFQGIAGVESMAFAAYSPFTNGGFPSAPVAADGYETRPGEEPEVLYNEIGPGYLATLGIPLAGGREFTRADNEAAPPVAVVNEAMAAQLWRGQDPVGRRLQVKGRWVQVVGLAKTSKYNNLTEPNRPFFYLPLRQGTSMGSFIVRTSLGPDSIAKTLLREVHSLDANLALGETITMREQVDRTTSPQRVTVAILCVFGALALLLSAIGLYGVMSYTVSQSHREMGLRMALGADVGELLRVVLKHGLVLTGTGVALGLLAALVLTRLMGYLLYKVSPYDPLVFGAALLVMTVTALAASLLPALRAARTDPVKALRT